MSQGLRKVNCSCIRTDSAGYSLRNHATVPPFMAVMHRKGLIDEGILL